MDDDVVNEILPSSVWENRVCTLEFNVVKVRREDICHIWKRRMILWLWEQGAGCGCAILRQAGAGGDYVYCQRGQHSADALQSQRGQGSKGDIWSGVGRAGREMGKNIDKTFIQSKMLNESKGPAVFAAAQADKSRTTAARWGEEPGKYGPFDHQAEVSELLVEDRENRRREDVFRGGHLWSQGK